MNLATTLEIQLRISQYALKINSEGITQKESLIQPAGGGSNFNWVLGHILASRDRLLESLGKAPLRDERTRAVYARGAPPVTDPDQALSIQELRSDLDASCQAVLDALRGLPEARLAETAPFSPTGNENETIGSLAASLVFHESYHTGQTGVLRRMLGKPGAIK